MRWVPVAHSDNWLDKVPLTGCLPFLVLLLVSVNFMYQLG